jgi:ribosomal protein L44E
MLFKFPKNDSEYIWTNHSKHKMLQYRIMPQKIKTILKTHDRKEEGIAPKTVAVMKRNDTPKRKEELWVMYQKLGNRVKGLGFRMKIISVWRYPGISPKGRQIGIPEDTLEYLTK